MTPDPQPVVAIVQARMGSGRLPGKVLADVAGEPMLARVLRRLGRARTLDRVVVATTTSNADDPIVGFCAGRRIPCHRGSEEDVLDRYYQTARAEHAGTVVRVTSDCPLIDPDVADRVIGKLLEANGGLDYVTNTLPPRTFPRGLDVEAFSFAALERAHREARERPEREHVTPYLYRHPDRFRVEGVFNPQDLSGHRWTVDEPADLEFVRTVFSYFGNDAFSWRELLEALAERPEWVEINAHIQQREVRV